MVLFGDSGTVRFFASVLLAHFLFYGGEKMKSDFDMIDLRITFDLGKSITMYKFRNLPEEVNYETALKVIKEIQEVMNLPYKNYGEVYEKIGYILGEYNIYYCVEGE